MSGIQDMWITPYSKASQFPWPWSLDDKVTIFEEQVLGWQIDVADRLINGAPGVPRDPHAGFAVLGILVSYFENIAKFEDGFAKTGSSQDYFKRGMLSVFPMEAPDDSGLMDEALGCLYDRVRCGLYHAAITGTGVLIDGGYKAHIAVRGDGKIIEINPLLWPEHLRKHLLAYTARLRDPKNQQDRERFERRFDWLHGSAP